MTPCTWLEKYNVEIKILFELITYDKTQTHHLFEYEWKGV